MQIASPDTQRLNAIEARLFQIEQRLKVLPLPLDEEMEARFHALVGAWKEGRGPVSSIQEMAMHPAYQQIIGMGEPAVPLLLAELKQKPGHWSWALRAITGENPVPPESRGKLNEMADAWLNWGRERGYLT